MSDRKLLDCKFSVEFRADSVVLVLYPKNCEGGLALSRFHLVMEESRIGDANVGGFGPIDEGGEGNYPLQMFDIEVEPKTAKGKKELKHIAALPPYKKVVQMWKKARKEKS